MTHYTPCQRLNLATPLLQFIDQQVLPGSNLDREVLLESLDDLVHDLKPAINERLAQRGQLHTALEQWQQSARPWRSFVEATASLQPSAGQVRTLTTGVDPELSDQAGPQILVDSHDRAALLDAVNARWGSLYQALYHSDAIARVAGHQIDRTFNPQRGARVVVQVRELLDRFAPLATGTHVDARHYRVRDGQLSIALASGQQTGLHHGGQFLGHQGEARQPAAILLGHHGLHIELRIDRQSRTGACDVAGISDVRLEAALSAVVDLQRDARAPSPDPLPGYINWLHLMQGRPGQHQDRRYQAAGGGELKLPGRALLLLRLNALDTLTPAVLDSQGQPTPRIVLDALLGSLIALHDRQRHGNTRTGNLYLLVPGLQGPQEVALVSRLFRRIETLLQMPSDTLKLGLTDEHWRTCLNLEACIQAAATRIAVLQASPEDRHAAQPPGWPSLARRYSVAVALACGLRGRAQIGLGSGHSCAEVPLRREDVLELLRDGASSAQVATASAATLLALHFHQVDVRAAQRGREQDDLPKACRALLDELLELRARHR